MADDTYVQAIRYEADIADVQRKLDDLANKQNDTEGKTGTAAGKMSKHWDGVRDSVGKIATGLGLLGAGALIMAPKILEGGAGLEALDQKASTVFGGSLGMVNTWAQANAKAMGLTSSQARDAAASVADLLKPMGFSADAAAGMSTDMLNLSGALSAWSGGSKSAAEVSDVMTKAMLGETDGLKGLGISISAADVAARLAKNGQSDLTGAALEQAQAIAVQQLIMEKSTDAQKAWSDGSMDAVKKQNATKASIEQVKESFTRALYPALEAMLPAITSIAEWLGTNLPIAIEKVRTWFEANWPAIREAVVPVLQGIQDFIVAFIGYVQGAWDTFGSTISGFATTYWGAISTTIGGVLDVIKGVFDVFKGLFTGDWSLMWDGIKGIVDGIKNIIIGAVAGIWAEIKLAAGLAWDAVKGTVSGAWDSIVGFVTGIPGRIAGTIDTLWDGIKTGITAAKDWVSGSFDGLVTLVTGLPGRMLGLFDGMWDGIKDAFKAAVNWVIDKWNNLSFHIGGGSVFGISLPSVTIDTPDIPRFHSGGIVPGVPGVDRLILAQAGEGVLSRDDMSQIRHALVAGNGGGKQIVINGGLHVSNPTGTSNRFVQELWRVAG